MELHKIETADGKVLFLSQKENKFIMTPTPGAWGMPSINYFRTKLYDQDIDAETGFLIDNRSFNISVRAQGCGRAQLFALRQEYLNIVRPNRKGQLTYTFVREDGIAYKVVGRVASFGFNGITNELWDDWAFEESFEVECIDPRWLASSVTSLGATAGAADQLVFPITFDGVSGIRFGSASQWGAFEITNYGGTIYTYPRIICTGGFDRVSFIHDETGLRIDYLAALATGDTLTIDLNPSYDSDGNYVGPTVTDSSGNDRTGNLGPLSDIAFFRIEPDGMVADGINTIRIEALNFDGTADFTMTYNVAYIGI